MLQFNPITTQSLLEIRPLLQSLSFRTYEFTAGAIYIWRHYYNNEYAIADNMLFMRSRYPGEETYYSLPVGASPSTDALRVLEPLAEDGRLLLGTVPQEALPALWAQYGDRLSVKPEPDWSDYLYVAHDLAALTGRRYRGQRNHINFFTRSHPEWQYHQLTPDNAPAVSAFYDHYPKKQGEGEVAAEQRATADVLAQFSQLPMLTGGYITTASGIVAFAIGEVVNDTLFVHIEKALRDTRGAYPMMVREFSADICARFPHVRFINREDDTGDAGLRAVKRSYHPAAMLKKHTVCIHL